MYRTVFLFFYCIIFFFKQKTAYEMRISDWSSDVCSSDLRPILVPSEDIELEIVQVALLVPGYLPDRRSHRIRVQISSDLDRIVNARALDTLGNCRHGGISRQLECPAGIALLVSERLDRKSTRLNSSH